MKTIAKAKTNKMVVDGWGRTYFADKDQTLIPGESYLVHNHKIKHILIPQSILYSGLSGAQEYYAKKFMEENGKKDLTGFKTLAIMKVQN